MSGPGRALPVAFLSPAGPLITLERGRRGTGPCRANFGPFAFAFTAMCYVHCTTVTSVTLHQLEQTASENAHAEKSPITVERDNSGLSFLEPTLPPMMTGSAKSLPRLSSISCLKTSENLFLGFYQFFLVSGKVSVNRQSHS